MKILKKVIVSGIIIGGIGAICYFDNWLPKSLLIRKLPKEKQEYFKSVRDSIDLYSDALDKKKDELNDSLELYANNGSYFEDELGTLKLTGWMNDRNSGWEIYEIIRKDGSIDEYTQSAYVYGINEETSFDRYARRTAQHDPLICPGFWGDGKKVIKWYGQDKKAESVLRQRYSIYMLDTKMNELKDKYSYENIETCIKAQNKNKLKESKKTRDQILEEKYKRVK
jgi:hypothetical protein